MLPGWPLGLLGLRLSGGMEEKDCKLVMMQMEEQVTSWGMTRTVLLYKLKLCLLDDKEVGYLNVVVDEMAKLGDVNGPDTMGVKSIN